MAITMTQIENHHQDDVSQQTSSMRRGDAGTESTGVIFCLLNGSWLLSRQGTVVERLESNVDGSKRRKSRVENIFNPFFYIVI